MGFWDLTPNVGAWSAIEMLWKSPLPPRLLTEMPIRTDKNMIKSNIVSNILPNITIRKIREDKVHEYPPFLKQYFSEQSQLCIPVETIKKGLQNGWIGIEARNNNNLIGIIFSIPFTYFFTPGFPKSPLRDIGLVDYFCIEPLQRKKGVGTLLLAELFKQTSKINRKAHIFASEGYLLFSKIPPFVKDRYYWRERNPNGYSVNIHKTRKLTNETLTKIITNNPTSFIGVSDKSDLVIHYSYNEKTSCANILIKSTYEQKDNKSVGEIIGWWIDEKESLGKKIEDNVINNIFDMILDNCKEFDIFLASSHFPKLKVWQKGSHYAYYAFHFHPGQFNGKHFIGCF